MFKLWTETLYSINKGGINKMKIIKSIKYFKDGAYCLKQNKSIKTDKDLDSFLKEFEKDKRKKRNGK
jgi:hypothetical protein